MTMSESTKDTKDTTTKENTSLSTTEKLINFINASHLKFTWFVGNLTVVLCFFNYLLTYRSNGFLNVFWYKLLFLGASTSFGIVLYQNKNLWNTNNSKSVKIKNLLKDDNTHYLYNALIWLIFPKRSLAIVSYFAFSIFHVLNLVGFELLPELQLFTKFIPNIQNFVKKNHELSRKFAASSELLLLIWLIIRAIFWKNWSWLNLFFYSVFIKLKIEASLFTRQILKNWEVRIDGLVSSPNVHPKIKQYWSIAKNGLKQLNKFSIIEQTEEETKK